MSEKTVLAIDPGRSKCGLCLVRRDSGRHLEILHRKIVPLEQLEAGMIEAFEVEPVSLVIVGSGTGSKQVIHMLREKFPGVGLLAVDEKDTSYQARERYWEHNPRPWWRRLVPSSLQLPPVPIDDFAALILAERVLLDG
jgi:RNase H-fold protein (predicted Holliday junction resolvase)